MPPTPLSQQSLTVRELSAAERLALPTLVSAAGLEVDDLAPPGWEMSSAQWWEDGRIRLALIDTPTPTFVLERGVSFAGDWVRDLWLIAPRGHLPPTLRAYVAWSRARGGIAWRWRVEAPLSPAAERFWLGLGAVIIGRERGGRYLLQLGGTAPPWDAAAGPFRVGAVRPSELLPIITWSQDPGIHRPLGFATPPAATSIGELLFPSAADRAGFGDLSLLAVRRGRRLVGMAIEHGWDFPGDDVREVTLALPGTGAPLSRHDFLRLAAVIMHACFRRGARRTIANVRAGASGEGFPRLFAYLGGTDVSDRVRVYGGGQSERRYFAADAAGFYGSRAARSAGFVVPNA